jgi:hypothetical protein
LDATPAPKTLISRARRYLPFYVVAVAWLVMVLVVPTTSPRSSGLALGGDSVGTLPPESGGAADQAGTGAAASGAGGSGGGATGAGAAAGTNGAGGAGNGAAGTTGKARSGVDCKPGVRQLPDSVYSAPCRVLFTGANGGATSRGVTSTEIKVVDREYANTPDEQAVEAQVVAAGFPPKQVRDQVRQVFLAYFNKAYELYGRHVVLETYQSNASVADEVRNEGREVACADATAIAQERKAFAVVPPPALIGLGPFSECAAEQQLMVPIGPYGFPESYYRQYHPYLWGLQMSCDRIAYQLGDYIGRQLANRKARWAKDPAYVVQNRTFALIYPNIGAYSECIGLIDKVLAKYGVTYASRFAYNVDPSTMPQQASQAVVQFKQAGATTIILAADFLMTTNLTLQGRQQGWGPEWITEGAGLTDVDNLARAFDQQEVNGHLFGISPLGESRYTIGQDGEAARLYKRLTGQPLPTGMAAEYFIQLQLFNMLQGAGPALTPANIATGMFAMPLSTGPDAGRYWFRTAPDGTPNQGDHTASDDVREVYWDGNATGVDGKPGMFLSAYARRFTNGEFPYEEPPNYPGR